MTAIAVINDMMVSENKTREKDDGFVKFRLSPSCRRGPYLDDTVQYMFVAKRIIMAASTGHPNRC